jgi:hypothetical protein
MRPFTILLIVLLFFAHKNAFSATYFENFTSYITGPTGTQCYKDGDRFGPWNVVFTGFGKACVVKTDPSTAWLSLIPAVAKSPGETHAALVSGLSFQQPYTYSVAVRTAQQLRLNSQPNAWEVAWVIWDYVPVGTSSKFYYFSLKRNGWEFGQFDSGSQRFIKTGNSPVLSLNSWYTFTVTQTGGNRSCRGALLNLSVKIGSTNYPLTTFCDTQKPITAGRIGFYTEDAGADYTNVYVTSP